MLHNGQMVNGMDGEISALYCIFKPFSSSLMARDDTKREILPQNNNIVCVLYALDSILKMKIETEANR
jgi:hypothetical protein